MLHVRIKLVSAIEKMSVQFKYPASNKTSFISEKRLHVATWNHACRIKRSRRGAGGHKTAAPSNEHH